jgi:hypothetical protein
MSNLYRGPSKDASYQDSIHLAMWFQRRRFFRNQPIRNKNGLWRPCLLTDRDEMSQLYRGPSIDDSYQVSVHLVKWFQRRTWCHRPFLYLSEGLISKKSSPLKPLDQMNQYLVGSILKGSL